MHPNTQSGQPGQSRVARLIHGALLSGVTVFALVAWLAPGRPPAPDSRLRYALPLVALCGFVGAHLLARRLPARTPGETEDGWWLRALPSAIMSWAIVEVVCLIACVTIFLTHDWTGLLWAGVGLVMFLLLSPRRLRDLVPTQ
jgi:hypothetical protein